MQFGTAWWRGREGAVKWSGGIAFLVQNNIKLVTAGCACIARQGGGGGAAMARNPRNPSGDIDALPMQGKVLSRRVYYQEVRVHLGSKVALRKGGMEGMTIVSGNLRLSGTFGSYDYLN